MRLMIHLASYQSSFILRILLSILHPMRKSMMMTMMVMMMMTSWEAHLLVTLHLSHPNPLPKWDIFTIIYATKFLIGPKSYQGNFLTPPQTIITQVVDIPTKYQDISLKSLQSMIYIVEEYGGFLREPCGFHGGNTLFLH